MYREIDFYNLTKFPLGTRVIVDGKRTAIAGKSGNNRRISIIHFDNRLRISDDVHYQYALQVDDPALDAFDRDEVIEKFIEDVIDVCSAMWKEDSEGGDEYLIEQAKKLKEKLGYVKNCGPLSEDLLK